MIKTPTILADDIAEAARCDFDKRNGGLYAKLSEEIASSQRMLFSKDATDACFNLIKDKPSSIEDAKKLATLPYDSIWVEYPVSTVERVLGLELNIDPENVRFCKIGCLLQTCSQNNRVFVGTLVFGCKSFRKPYKGFTYRQLREGYGPILKVCPVSLIFFLDSSSEVEANLNPNSVTTPYANLMYKSTRVEFNCFADKRYNTNVDKNKDNMDMHCGSWFCSDFLIPTLMCLINSRNCTEYTAVANPKLNKARSIRGQPPLLTYTSVDIGLSKAQKAHAIRTGMSEAEIRLHTVRGHFKTRKSGVYWWRPFLRGSESAGVVNRKAYIVNA